MSTGRAFLLLIAATVLAVPRFASAWADGGHKAVAIIAWEQLGEKERAWVASLLHEHPLWEEHFKKPTDEELGASPDEATRQKWLFAQAAVWPDIIRGPRGAQVNPWEKWHRATWHYIEYPVFPTDAARTALEDKVKPGPMDWQPGRASFLEAQLNAVQTLKKAVHDLADTSLPAADRAVMLCWLFHLVGDIHQPCHAATLFDPEKLSTGDRGGNGTSIEGLPSKPLHAYWDNLLGAPGTSFAEAGKNAADLLKQASPTDEAMKSKKEFAPEAWARESNAEAKLHVYSAPVLAALASARVASYTKNDQRFSSVTLHMTASDLAEYQKTSLIVGRKRVLTAGLRLAEGVRTVANPAAAR